MDKTKPGFLWDIFQNETVIPNDLADAELALAGQLTDTTAVLLDNWADPTVSGVALAAGVKVGTLYRFEIPTVLNVSLVGGGLNGSFTPNDQMPGIPGIDGGTTGIDAEVITFADLPAGWVTSGATSPDRPTVAGTKAAFYRLRQ